MSGGTMPIAAIHVGERHRKDMGDIAGLARSIADVGLLHPVVVAPDGTLIAGERRLIACRKLGWADVPVTEVDLDAVVRGEFAENAERKDFTLSEAVAIKRALEPREREAAKERQREHGNTAPGRQNTPEKFSTVNGRALDKVARVVGKHRTTLAKAEAVVDAAEAEPERFGKLLADMDRTGQVNGVFKRLQVITQGALIRSEPPPLPGRGPYRVIVADPPWPYEKRAEDPSHRARTPYPQMSIAAICALDVRSIAAVDSILWLWVTNHHMREAFDVLAAWGFTQKTILTWAKDRMVTGDWLRGQTEHVLMAVRGNPIVTLTNETTLLPGPVRAHSQKPEEFYALVERLCPAPRYAELFARTARPGWDGHGNEVLRDFDAEVDARDSYTDAVRAVGERVKNGSPIPPFFLSEKGDVR
jgi:N6-adenosine-specific RNA methylase IME4